MTLAVSLAMKRCLALLLPAILPLQGPATLVTHTFACDNGHGAPLVQAHDGQQDGAEYHSAHAPYDDTASCCVFAGACYGSLGLTPRPWSPLAAGFATEPVLIALYPFSSFAPEFPERPPSVLL